MCLAFFTFTRHPILINFISKQVTFITTQTAEMFARNKGDEINEEREPDEY